VQAGDTNAAVILADHYIRGDGVPVNCDQARVLLLVASEKNNKAAIQMLRNLSNTGCPATPPQ
jgi:TPR repeat protein